MTFCDTVQQQPLHHHEMNLESASFLKQRCMMCGPLDVKLKHLPPLPNTMTCAEVRGNVNPIASGGPPVAHSTFKSFFKCHFMFPLLEANKAG